MPFKYLSPALMRSKEAHSSPASTAASFDALLQDTATSILAVVGLTIAPGEISQQSEDIENLSIHTGRIDQLGPALGAGCRLYSLAVSRIPLF